MTDVVEKRFTGGNIDFASDWEAMWDG